MLATTAWKHLGMPGVLSRTWGITEAIAGILILVGAWTQIIAILVFVGVFCGFFVPWMRVYPKSTMFLAMVMCVSLLVTGAGAVAFDLPL